MKWPSRLKLIESTPAADVDRACARAAHFGNFSLDALRRIVEQRLFERPLDDLTIATPEASNTLVAVRRLEAYTELLGGWPRWSKDSANSGSAMPPTCLKRIIRRRYAKLGYLEFLETLIDDELSTRDNKGLDRRLRAARFPVTKTLEEFRLRVPTDARR